MISVVVFGPDLSNHTNQEIKDGREKPAASQPSDSLKTFMQHLNRALKTKTGVSQGVLARRIYGICVPYLRRHPEESPYLSTEIDLLPREWTGSRYVSAIRALIHEREAQEDPVNPKVREVLRPLTAGIG